GLSKKTVKIVDQFSIDQWPIIQLTNTLCPNDEVLKYNTTNREGYKEYKSNPDKCKNCPFLEKCTASKNYQKVVTRHVWEEYREEVADHIRHTDNWKEIYPQRKKLLNVALGMRKLNTE
ncbi:MAG TPA: transposase, partial [Erysipelothrix sp.]|nr:transposase [Erysipelothrix sp.]